MMKTRLAASFSFLVAVSGAWGQAPREFDWIPSGKIAVGDERSEAAAAYRGDASAVVRVELPYLSGRKVAATARQAKEESFRVRVATYRGGPCTGALAIRRRWDTAQPAATLKLKVGDKELAPWAIPAFAGNRRWIDLFYTVPAKALMTPDGKAMRAEVPVAVSSESPTLSSEYAFFITRDWEVLGEDHLGAIVRKEGDDPKLAYLNGIAALGESDHEAARKAFEKAAAEPANELARLARRMVRLVQLRSGADALAAAGPLPPREAAARGEAFRAHYLLGLYASANGFWEEALDELQKAVACNPTHADATYKLAEAMEYNRMPVETYAPVLERAGSLYNRPDTHVEDVLVAINTRAVKDVCGELSLGSLDALYRDWRIVEQMVYGASRGAWRLRTTYRIWGPGSAEWVMQAGWIFSPPDSEIPIRGTYDYSIGTAEYGSSHAGGVDCGVAGAGGAQIGPTRGWEVLLHEWNHEFDWVCIFGEQVPGYPVTHDSDGCGKQPIVNMGCGHRSAMHYYVNPAEYRRHEAASPELPGNHIKLWGLAELTVPPVSGNLESWIVESKGMTKEELDALKKQWEAERKKDAKTPDWKDWFRPRWNRVRLLDKLASPREAELAARPDAVRWTRHESKADFVDLLQAFPKAPDKAVAYAQTFIFSPKKQETRLWLGYNDCMAAWLNGRKIHKGSYYACAKWDDANRTDMVANTAKLEEGWNRLLCKIERGGGGWGFSVGLTTFDNRPVEGLKYDNKPPSKLVPLYQPPKAGPYYKWDDVKEDYIELLPTLTEKDLQAITGIAALKARETIFYLDAGAAPAGARVVPDPMPDPKAPFKPGDHQLNNFLNWDSEAVAAIRFQRDGKPRDLLLIRPEYFEEYLELLAEKGEGLPGSGPKGRILGTMKIENPVYPSTGNRVGRRYVLVVETSLGDYPLDEQDILMVKAR
jgi:hypothetical protein